MEDQVLLIHDLAKQAGVTVRTIRYYTDEGLLPQPIIRGKYAYYTLEHLHRLELIRRMKEAYLPLREIRRTLMGLSDEEVCKSLEDSLIFDTNADIPDPASKRISESGADAMDYISRLMDQQSGLRSPQEFSQLPPKSAAPVPAPAPLVPASQVFVARDRLPQGETWLRIVLGPGIELNVRDPLDPANAQIVQQLIGYAQKLIQKNQKGG
jgi:DNA-binding transcriptional MerR regulator